MSTTQNFVVLRQIGQTWGSILMIFVVGVGDRGIWIPLGNQVNTGLGLILFMFIE